MTHPRCTLAGPLTVQEIGRAYAEVLAVSRDTEPARLDLSGVSDLDTSGLQVLLALRAALVDQGRALDLGPLPDAVASVAREMGCLDLLLPSGAASTDGAAEEVEAGGASS